MQKLIIVQPVFKLSLLIFFALVILSCAANRSAPSLPVQSLTAPDSPVLQEKEKWRFFFEINKGDHHLLIDTGSISRYDDADSDGVFKCSAKIIPSPKRETRIRESVSEGNREAGLDMSRNEQFVSAWIKRETKLYNCEIACKQKKFFLHRNKQHIIEYDVPEDDPVASDFMKKVCR